MPLGSSAVTIGHMPARPVTTIATPAPAAPRSVLMLGTFGVRSKGTLSARALGIGHALRAHGWHVALTTTPWDDPRDAGRVWDERGIRVSNTRARRPSTAPLAIAEMVAGALTAQPSLIHVFKPKGFGDLASRLLRHRLPVVVDMDDWEGDGGWNDVSGYGHLERRLFDWQERSAPRWAPAVTTASRLLQQRALALGAPADRVFYVPNGLSRRRFSELTIRSVPDSGTPSFHDPAPRILLYTRFVEFAPESLVPMLTAVRRSFPEARLVIAGRSANGAAEERLLQAARAGGVSDAIQLLGWIDPAALPAISVNCDVAVHPFDDTLINHAKSSVKLLELMAAGIPVVTTAVGENTSFIEDGQSGFLVPPGDQAALADAVSRLLANPLLRRRLAAQARARVEQRFLWDVIAPSVLEAYARAVEERR